MLWATAPTAELKLSKYAIWKQTQNAWRKMNANRTCELEEKLNAQTQRWRCHKSLVWNRNRSWEIHVFMTRSAIKNAINIKNESMVSIFKSVCRKITYENSHVCMYMYHVCILCIFIIRRANYMYIYTVVCILCICVCTSKL